jgi:putative transposase
MRATGRFFRSPTSSAADCGEFFGAADPRKGDCWDNACSESLFGSLKVERLHRQRFKTRLQARDEAAAWLLWYNSIRLHSTLAYVSPMQFEKTWLAAQHRQANP